MIGAEVLFSPFDCENVGSSDYRPEWTPSESRPASLLSNTSKLWLFLRGIAAAYGQQSIFLVAGKEIGPLLTILIPSLIIGIPREGELTRLSH
jgi:hypothetical protein